MKSLLYLILIIFTFEIAQAQITITGYVKDKTGDSIIGANVYLKGTYDGASTDENGYFKFTTDNSGDQILVVAFIGFKTLNQPIKLDKSPSPFQFVLTESINELKAVVISAGSFTADDEAKQEVLKPLDIVTTAGATADIAGALNTLPGTQTVGEQGRLFVRGGSGHETKTFIDGMQVLNAYNSSIPNTPGRGRFSPMMFKGASFSTGGYSAEYGQALSSALILNTKDIPNHDRLDLGIMSVGLSAGGTKVWDKNSVAGKIQYTNLTPYFKLVEQKFVMDKAPEALEANFAFRQQINDNGTLKLYGNINQSSLISQISDIDNPDILHKYAIDNKYRYINASYKDIISKKWSVRSGLSYTFNQDKIGQDTLTVNEKEDGYHFKTALGFDPNDQVGINFGVEVFKRQFQQNIDLKSGHQIEPLTFEETIVAGFAEAEFYASNNFVTKAGLRFEHNNLNNDQLIAPRLSLAYKTSDNSQLSLAFGQFHQSAENQWLKINPNLKVERANHYLVNYQWQKEGRILRAEAYYKDYSDLVKFDQNNIDSEVINNQGNGYASGFDLFWRDNKTFDNVDYWISYSYLDTERNYLNFPYKATPTFASKHNFSIVYKHFIDKIKTQVGMSYSFASGRPYNDPNSNGFNSGKTRAYHDLSMNFSYLWKSNIIIHGSVTNVLGTKNIFGYEYSDKLNENGQYNSRAITPMAPRFVFLGVFITLSKNKTLNELPNL
ncbi:TonB-dependent receptor [Marinigracilibium pacificum]|uniref:TonB-dependent receptor n=1 Tax=Marinigracilibium pacificum TaxID=2729599 RepID=A0A848IWY2_9BACT|nr:TonB-dependent receptor [Marinigracilibium pacificum]NMM47678.1 TonB-dependent receptor [Marinigracilibium pacificum]